MFTLQQEDKVCLESSAEWLNYRIINAAQIMLKSQCDYKLSGWQNVLLRSKPLRMEHRSSSLAVSSVGCDSSTLKVYDSICTVTSALLQLSKFVVFGVAQRGLLHFV